MTKIAFLDVDQTLVDNHSSEYNENLINFLIEHEFDEVYLVTGRNTNDFWQHVLQRGNKPNNWRAQLLCNVVDNLRAREINVVGVSTPYDHYLKKTASDFVQPEIIKSGDSAEQIYMPFEQKISALNDSEITAQVLHRQFSALTGGDIYENGLGEKSSLTDALPMYLAVIQDTEKKGQFGFLLERVEAENEGNLDVFFFDDKPENLDNAQALFATHKRITAYFALVDRIHNYTVPDKILVAASNDSASVSVDNGIANKYSISLAIYDDSLVPCFPVDENLENYFRDHGFEVLTQNEQSIIYTKDYSPDEQAERDDGYGFHAGYSLQGFFDFIKEKNQDENCYYHFDLSHETQEKLNELLPYMSEEAQSALINAFLQKSEEQEFEEQEFAEPQNVDNYIELPEVGSRGTFLALLEGIKAKQENRLKHYPDANTAVNTLVHDLDNAAIAFYNAELTADSINRFQSACTKAIEECNNVLGDHRKTFGQLFAGIKIFFVVLKKTLSFSSEQERTHRMKFFDTRTDSAKILHDLAEDITETIKNPKP